MKTKKAVTRVGKGLMVLNLATVTRVLRSGFVGLRPRLNTAYNAIDPFDSAGDTHLRRIPEILLHEVIGQYSSINIDSKYSLIDGSLPWVDLCTLLAVALDRRPKIMLEIGTFFGHTTRLLALNLPGSTIHTLDLPLAFDRKNDQTPIPKDDFHLIKERRVGAAFGSESPPNIVQHFGDSATWDYGKVKGATLFLIDGSHTYEYARNDTERCLAVGKGRPCTLLWHDCDGGHPGVVRYLAELADSGVPVKHIIGTNLAILDVQ